jgi:hypothetical protein
VNNFGRCSRKGANRIDGRVSPHRTRSKARSTPNGEHEPVTNIKTETTISTIPPTIITAGTNPDSPHWPIICPTFITPRSWRRDLSDAVDKLPLSERD